MTTKATIVKRIIIEGTMQLLSPLLIGSGTEEDKRRHETDISVLTTKEGKPFIPGTSLAGVLRRTMDKETAALLFGHSEEEGEQALQSAVQIQDILLENAQLVTRDGVHLDTYTQTAIDGGKYDYEAVERGAAGKLHIEIALRQYHVQRDPYIDIQIQCLVDTLASHIRVGALTAKGFGRIASQNVQAQIYDFTDPDDAAAWLLRKPAKQVYRGSSTAAVPLADSFVVEGQFALVSSLLVRDGELHVDASDPENAQKQYTAHRTSRGEYVIPGTTIKGVLRHRAAYILRTLTGKDCEDMLKPLMGYTEKKAAQKSRFLTDEVYFKQGVSPVRQTRNSIDRFTGSTMESRLFTEEPVWQQEAGQPVLTIRFEIQRCAPWEAGLALFLLRDLWTGRLALGGDAAVGRGYVQGCKGTISYEKNTWRLNTAGKVTDGDPSVLQKFADALQQHVKEVQA